MPRSFWSFASALIFVALILSGGDACTSFAAAGRDASVENEPSRDGSVADGQLSAAPLGGFCSSNRDPATIACWDFDESTDATAGFTGSSRNDGGSFDVVDKELVMRLEDIKRDRSVFLFRQLSIVAGERLELSYRFQVRESQIASVYLGVFIHYFDVGSGSPLGVASYSNGSEVGAVPKGTERPAPDAKWRRAVVTLDRGSGSLRGSVVVDGNQLYDGPFDRDGAPNFGVFIGAIYANNAGGRFEVRFDDVLLRKL